MGVPFLRGEAGFRSGIENRGHKKGLTAAMASVISKYN